MALDAEDLAAISKLLDEKTKGFVTTEQAGKLVGEQVTTAITAATSTLSDDVMKAIADAGVGDGDGGNDGGKGKGKGNTSGESDEMKRHKAEMAQMTADMEAAKAAQEAATQRERQSRLDTQMGVALQAAGVPLDRVPHASAYLRTLNNTKGAAFLGFDDNGQPQWNGVHAAGYDDVVGLKEGIAGFMNRCASSHRVQAGSHHRGRPRHDEPPREDLCWHCRQGRLTFTPGHTAHHPPMRCLNGYRRPLGPFGRDEPDFLRVARRPIAT